MALFPKKEEIKPDPKVVTTPPVFDPKALTDALTAGFKALAIEQAKHFEVLATKINTGKPTPPAPEPKKALAEADLDRMTNSQLFAHMMSQIKDTISESIKPVAEVAEGASTDLEKKRIVDAFKEVEKTYPDFAHFKPKMAELLRKNPALAEDPDDLYHLAKARAPEIVEKLTSESKAAEEQKQKEANEKSFTGFFPTNEAGKTESKGDDKPKDVHQVLSEVWDQTMGAHAAALMN